MAKLGGHYYRVTEWDKVWPDLPVSPKVTNAIWRRHNLLMDIIETTEAMKGVQELDIVKENIPENGIGNWTVSDNKGMFRDEEAYKDHKTPEWWASIAKMGNHCQGHDYHTIHDTIKEAKKKLGKNIKADRLLQKIETMPLGSLIEKDSEALCDLYYLCPKQPVLRKEVEEKAEKLLNPGSPPRDMVK